MLQTRYVTAYVKESRQFVKILLTAFFLDYFISVAFMVDLVLVLQVLRVGLSKAAMWVRMNSNLGFDLKDIQCRND